MEEIWVIQKKAGGQTIQEDVITHAKSRRTEAPHSPMKGSWLQPERVEGGGGGGVRRCLHRSWAFPLLQHLGQSWWLEQLGLGVKGEGGCCLWVEADRTADLTPDLPGAPHSSQNPREQEGGLGPSALG